MTLFDRQRRVWIAALWLLALAAAAARVAVADDAAAPAASAAQPAPQNQMPTAGGSFPPQPPPAEKRGFLNSIGNWWDQSFGDFNAKMQAARQRIDDLNAKQGDAAKDAAVATEKALNNAAQATKDAANAMVRLPSTRVLELRDRCVAAANGAPDCTAAAVNACRKKGFSGGQPIDVSTSENCPAAVILSGRTPAAGECPEETVVLRVVCQ